MILIIMKTRVRRRKKKYFIFGLALVAYAGWILLKPLPQLQPDKSSIILSAKTPASSLVWPASQSAVSIVGTDILETNITPNPVPNASTSKMITALMVLKAKPLQLNQQGPVITLTDKDVAIYKDYVARDGSVVPILAGEQISQYQALQTVMLPSANNIADSLAIWAYGSLAKYAKAANAYLKQQGINDTNVGADASGLAANSTSTSADLARIGALAMQNPVLAEIVGQSTATGIPVVGTIKNVNDLIGINNIIGIKTGSSVEAGGAYVSAAQTKVNEKTVVITTAVLSAPSRFIAMKDTLPLTKSAQANFTPVTVAKQGQIIGKYILPWGGSVDAVATKELSISAWNGTLVKAPAVLEQVPASSEQGGQAGHIILKKSAINDKKTVSVILKSTPTQPSAWWRLTHPF